MIQAEVYASLLLAALLEDGFNARTLAESCVHPARDCAGERSTTHITSFVLRYLRWQMLRRATVTHHTCAIVGALIIDSAASRAQHTQISGSTAASCSF